MFEQISIFDLIEPESRFTCEIRSGSGFEHGRVRVYLASRQMPVDELAKYMRSEYGVGGHSITFPDGESGFADHDSRGITLRVWKSHEIEKHSWREAAVEAKRLIAAGEYLTEKDRLYMRQCEEQGKGSVIPYPRMAVI